MSRPGRTDAADRRDEGGRPAFIDSTALGVLLGALETLRAHDGKLSIVCAEESILRLFEVTGLNRIFEIRGTRAEALGSINPD